MLLKDLTIDDYTTPAPSVVGPSTSIAEAYWLMEERGVRHLPVLDDGEVVGIISDRDLRSHVGKTWARQLSVGELMQHIPVGVRSGTPLGEAAFIMAKYKIGSLLVYDSQGHLDGIFTDTDALNALVDITDQSTEEF